MKHPLEVLKPEYSQLLAAMVVREECRGLVDETAVKLIGYKSRYAPVTAANGVPVVFIAASFEREADSNFTKNPAQGWPLNGISRDVPHNGPFRSWFDAAIAAYHLDGLDAVGAANWTWELMCFYGETFNGFGYRDYYRMHSPYLWGGTNIQTRGKYTSDRKFDPNEMDQQLGIIPVARRMIELDASLALPSVPFVPSPPVASGIAGEAEADAKWVQRMLNGLGHYPPLAEDANYGRATMMAVAQFQKSYGLEIDGFAGPKTLEGLRAAVATKERST